MSILRDAWVKWSSDGTGALLSSAKSVSRRFVSRRVVTPVNLLRTHLSTDNSVREIGSVMRKTYFRSLDSRERSAVEHIESLRDSVDASTERLAVTFYIDGPAGEPIDREFPLSEASKSDRGHGLMLFNLCRSTKPTTVLELGTGIGVSGAYLATALQLNGQGSLVTIEGSDTLASRAAIHFERLGLSNVSIVRGHFQEVLEEVIDANRPFELAYIDGHHNQAATLRYTDQILPAMADGSFVVYDDIYWSDGMERAWHEIKNHQRLTPLVETLGMGVCVVGDSTGNSPYTVATG